MPDNDLDYMQPSTLAVTGGSELGPVDRLMDPWMRKALTSLAPAKYRDSLINNYQRNRGVWNVGAAALAGTGITAAAKALGSIFSKKDNSRQQGSAIGNTLSWLAPIALLAGGTYLWNKHGDKVIGKANEGLSNLKAAVAADKKWENRYRNILGTIRKLPLIGNWAANKIHNTVDKGI